VREEACSLLEFEKKKGEDKMADTAYCMKCKKPQVVKDGAQVTMKNGRKALKGKCSVCGTTMFKMLPK
jgi:RNase P subunit RPR2